MHRLALPLVVFALWGGVEVKVPPTWRVTVTGLPLLGGFEDVGDGLLLVARDVEPARNALAVRPLDTALTLERFSALTGPSVERAAEAIVSVLLVAFGVEADRRAGLHAETRASLADARLTHYVVRRDDAPVAVARRATFDGISYLSSIGTVDSERGRGLGRFVTASAMVDAAAADSEWIHLGVFSDNIPARRLYERLGFERCPEYDLRAADVFGSTTDDDLTGLAFRYDR